MHRCQGETRQVLCYTSNEADISDEELGNWRGGGVRMQASTSPDYRMLGTAEMWGWMRINVGIDYSRLNFTRNKIQHRINSTVGSARA